MRTVLTGAVLRPDGRLALTFSDRPGHRVTVVADAATLTEELAADIAATVIPLITRGRTEGNTT